MGTQTQPRERPILFSAPMVRAILDGSKTQTRREVTPRFGSGASIVKFEHLWCGSGLMTDIPDKYKKPFGCKFGEVGDRLWVREAWCQAADENDRMKYNADGNLDSSCCHYRADGYEVVHIDGAETKSGLPRSPWVPSIHMPRWASRITLEITGVRVERLGNITEDDAKAEGVLPTRSSWHLHSFADLWESINGKDSWAANPWVWVISFRRLQPVESTINGDSDK